LRNKLPFFCQEETTIKPLVSLALVLVALIMGVPVLAQEEKKQDVKCNVDYLEKTLGIKLKSAKLMDAEKTIQAKITLEFTKDISDTKQLYETFTPGTGGMNIPRLMFFCFDEDNVVLTSVPLKQLSGQLTGKTGDAFWVLVDFGPIKNIKKIEVRPIKQAK
jgi:hypothetical protein